MAFLNNLFNTPSRPPRPEKSWFLAGLTSEYPNIATSDDTVLSSRLPCTDITPISVNSKLSSISVSTSDSTSIEPSTTLLPAADTTIQTQKPACKIFHVPIDHPTEAKEINLKDLDDIQDLKGQVMVFQYQSKFFAVDHRCPHSSYPLSNGTPFDIEDFGVVLSKGIRCPKHGWSFDLFRGVADRGGYKLGVWEVEVREGVREMVSGGGEVEGVDGVKEVWVRRKLRIG